MRDEWIYLLGMLLQLTDADMLNPSAQGSNTSSLPKTRIVNASSLSQPCALQLAPLRAHWKRPRARLE